MNPKVRNKFSKRTPVILHSTGEDLTQQHFREEVSINNIIAKYNKTGVINHVSRNRLRFGEFRDLAEHITDIDKVTKAQQSFETLPATLRNEFGNSIEGFFKFVKNPANNEQLIKWGILDPIPPSPETPKTAQQFAGEPSPQSTKSGNIKKTPKISSEEPS